MDEDDAAYAERAIRLAAQSPAVPDDARTLLSACSNDADTRSSGTTAKAGDLRTICETRQRIMSAPDRRGPRFRGFGETASALSALPAESVVRTVVFVCAEGTLQVFSDIAGAALYGVVFALIPNNLYWKRYVEDRMRIAYAQGYGDAKQGRPPKEAP